MMDYEIFKEVVKESFLSYMPDSYHGMEVSVSTVDKVNRRLDGLNLFKTGVEKGISPTIYINDIYGEYLKTGDLQETLRNAAGAMDRVFKEIPLPPLDVCMAKDNIIFQLVNTKQNEDMLRDMPHREFQDLSIIYRWVVDIDDKKIGNTLISNSLAKALGMEEEQLFNAATKNTRRILPPVVKTMNEVLREMLMAEGMPPHMADLMMGEMLPDRTMWIITNEQGVDGAVSMLYEDKVHNLAESLGSDLYILPSSVHEVIAVSVNMGEPENLAQMVAEVNMSSVRLEERLSNQVYHYDKELRKFTLASDTPNKRLDGIVAEQEISHKMKKSR